MINHPNFTRNGIQTLQNWSFMALGKRVNTKLQSQATNQGIEGAGRMRLFATMRSKAKSGPGRMASAEWPKSTPSVSSGTEIRKLTSSDQKKHQHEPVPGKHWGPPRSCSRWNLGCWAPENFVNSRIATLTFSQAHFQSFQSFSWPNNLWSKIFCISADILIEIHRFSFKNWQKKSVPHRFTVAPPTNSVGWLPAMPQLRSWYLVDWRKTWRIC